MQKICSHRHKDALILSSDVAIRGRLQRTILLVFKWLKDTWKMEGNDPSKKEEKDTQKSDGNKKDADSNANQEKKGNKEEESDKDQKATTDICPLSGNPKR